MERFGLKLLWQRQRKLFIAGGVYLVVLTSLAFLWVGVDRLAGLTNYSNEIYSTSVQLHNDLATTSAELASRSATLIAVLGEDQRVRNDSLERELKDIKKTYAQAAATYERLVDLRAKTTKTATFDDAFAKALTALSDRKYGEAGEMLTKLRNDVAAEEQKIASEFKIPENVPVNNSPPGAGYSRQQVQTDIGTYMISIVSADLNSTRVIVDTASDGDCANDCPVMSLGEYVSRSGGFAGINGPYFCPASYPSCAGKTNSFDTLLMNKNKHYFNSDNNVYSTVPAVIFSGNGARYVGRSLEWGRDTGVDSVIANQPLLVLNGEVAFGGDGDPKKGSKGGRSFIGTTGNMVYIGVVHNATVAEGARVLKAMGVQNALNLDSGGSTALWSGGYKVGPGRNTPFGIVLVRK